MVRAEVAEVRAGLEVLGERVAASLGQMVAAVDLAELRADMESQMVEQCRLVLSEAVAQAGAQADARAAEMAADASRPKEAAVAMEEFAALRSELREALSATCRRPRPS